MVDNVLHDLVKSVLEEQIKQGKAIARIEVDLKEHKEGVIQNRGEIKETKKRVEVLEEPEKVKYWLYKHSYKILAFISAVIAIGTKIANMW